MLKIEDIKIGDELKEKQKWLDEREIFYKTQGFYLKKNKYVFCENVKHIVTNKTASTIEIFCGKKTNKGVDILQWFSMKDFNERFYF